MAFTRSIASSQIAGFHHAEHRAEELGAVREAVAGWTPHFTPGLTRCGLSSTCSRGMHGPFLAGLRAP